MQYVLKVWDLGLVPFSTLAPQVGFEIPSDKVSMGSLRRLFHSLLLGKLLFIFSLKLSFEKLIRKIKGEGDLNTM